jgi:hypothetical protein
MELVVDNRENGERGPRKLRPEEAYREVNERIVRLNQVFESPEGEFLCECANSSCAERLRLSLGEYEAIRADPRRFLMASGHEPRGAKVVEQHDGWEVVVERRLRRPRLALVLH